MRIKVNPGLFSAETAQKIADKTLKNIIEVSDNYCQLVENKGNSEIEALLNEVLTNIMKISIRSELIW